jgi:septal ring factor EnvC (AmiA/AmiB activator)
MSTRWILAVCFVTVPSQVFSQKPDRELKKKETELQRLRSDIQSFEKKIVATEAKERATIDHLDNLERQSNLIRSLITTLHGEEQSIAREIDSARGSIEGLELQLQSLKSHYAGYVRSVYKNGRVYDLELLFSARSVNQMLIRVEYLKRFSERRAEDLRSIQEKKTRLERENEELQVKLDSERQLIAEKAKEEATLRGKSSERRSLLRKVRKDKQTYQKELTRKSAAAQKIEELIAELIEKERVRKEREAEEERKRLIAARERAKTEKVQPTLPRTSNFVSSTNFHDQRGKLRWPVSRGSVQSKFGPQVHPILKTITQNSGIDITTPAGSDIYAVADAEVAVLSFIPGFGNVVILNHANGYRSVYAHLAEIGVVESQRLREGTVIGKSDDSISGSMLHFEIWHDRDKQNPESWLAKR